MYTNIERCTLHVVEEDKYIYMNVWSSRPHTQLAATDSTSCMKGKELCYGS